MSQTPPVDPPFDPRAKRRKAFGRFLVAHGLAYVPAFTWAVAWVPIAILRHFEELEKVAHSEKAVSDFVLRQMIVPILVVALVPHLAAIPWIRDAQRRWLVLFAAVTIALTIAGAVVAIVYWAKLFAGR